MTAPASSTRTNPVRRSSGLLVAMTLTAVATVLAIRPAPLRSSTTATADFINFESLQVHPLAMTPDGSKLLALNTPDARLEVFAIGEHALTSLGEIPVGLEPVSVAAWSDSIAWVVDNVSDDVSVVDLARLVVTATFRVGDEPTDVVFAGAPRRAFVCVSGEDAVKIYSPSIDPSDAPILAGQTPIPGRHPRALAARANEVYVAILDAGNRTSALSAAEVQTGGGPPPPDPPLKEGLPPPPAVGLIVQQVAGAWVDERGAAVKTWNALIPYDMPDRDVVVLDASSGSVLRTVSDVGTSLFDIAVAPASGDVFVTNTEAFNRTRFEPNLRGRFLQDRLTRITAAGAVSAWDLNEHIVHEPIPGPPGEKDLSLSQPIGVAVDAVENRVYVAALGSDKVGVVDAGTGHLVSRIPTSLAVKSTRNGPTGLALDDARGQLFVLNRFSNSIAIVDLASEVCVGERALAAPNSDATHGFDPSPPDVVEGRRFLYDGTLSEHGDLACASCHIAANLDNVAWDLGDPQGDMTPVPPGQPPGLPAFHPMKGPMTTQTLRGLRNLEPLHWRGDRVDFLRFNPAFVSLLGNADSLPALDMQRFRDFILTVAFPPNPNQNLDRTVTSPATGPSAARGKNEFLNVAHDGTGGGPGTDSVRTCVFCHALPEGTNRIIIPGAALQESQAFKVPELRNLYQKSGFTDGPGPQKRGFGFIHDGSIDNLVDFLRTPVFTFPGGDAQRRDVEAFLLSFDTGMAPSVGRELTVRVDTKGLPAVAAELDSLYDQADVGNCDLVVHGILGGERRAFEYFGYRSFQSDYDPEGIFDADQVLALLVAPGDRLTYLGVPPGSGVRMGVDRDRDGYKDRWEIALGSNPADPSSVPAVAALSGDAPRPMTKLLQNAPNPFNPFTVIRYDLARGGRVRLQIFDAAGRLVRALVDANQPPGPHATRWDGRDDRGREAASGRYFCKLTATGRVFTETMTLLR